MKTFDIAILGSGPGGYVAALYASKIGRTVCLIEKDALGGTCLNRGCIPTKVMLRAASLFRSIKDASPYGIITDNIVFDSTRLFEQRRAVVEKLRKGVETLLRSNGVALVRGRGMLAGSGLIDVGEERIKAKDIIIATGSRPLELPNMKFDGAKIVSSETLLKSEEIPESILVVGGGVIGCEFAQFYATLGKKAVIVELFDRLLPGMDREISKKLDFDRRRNERHQRRPFRRRGNNRGQSAYFCRPRAEHGEYRS